MIKRIYTLLILISTFTGYSQDVVLLKNYNPKVKELDHNLNYNRDSLLLGSENKIIKVDIFNEDYDQTYDIKDFQTRIPIYNLPKGKFVVEVQLMDKIVEMHIVKHHSNNNLTDSSSRIDNKSIVEGQGMMLDEKLNVIKSPPKNSIEFLLTRSKTNKPRRVKQKFFWIIQEVSNGNKSYKSMKLVDERAVTKMISKNKLISETNYGKLNKLSVWEVYDTTKFVKKQTINPNYINSSSSDLFNVEPYYMSSENLATATM